LINSDGLGARNGNAATKLPGTYEGKGDEKTTDSTEKGLSKPVPWIDGRREE